MDVDVLPNPNVAWHQDRCPWNEAEGADLHRCAVKNVSICKYFKGVKYPDIVLCGYSNESDGT